jgi:hypothetical protein
MLQGRMPEKPTDKNCCGDPRLAQVVVEENKQPFLPGFHPHLCALLYLTVFIQSTIAIIIRARARPMRE